MSAMHGALFVWFLCSVVPLLQSLVLSHLRRATVRKQDALPLHARLESPIISPTSQLIEYILALDDDDNATLPVPASQSQSLSYASHLHPVQPLIFPTTPRDPLFCIHPARSPHQRRLETAH